MPRCLAVALAAAAGFGASPAAAADGATGVLAVGLASVLGLLIGVGLYARQRRRLTALHRQISSLLSSPDGSRPDPVDGLSADFLRLREALTDAQSQLEAQSEQRKKAEAALRQSEERYALAVRGANDGLWEWNIKNGTMHLSPRWKAMLGFTDDEFTASIEAWKSRIHREDLIQVETALRNHVDGFTPRFDSEHRLMHKDGSHRWVLSRGSAIRHASGSAYRMLGLDTDITQFKRMEEIMMLLAEGTSGNTGEAFFRALVKNFAAVLGVRMAFVTECIDYPTTRVRTLACFDRGGFRDAVEYDLAGTPCEKVIRGSVNCFHPTDLEALFPSEKGLTSYYGMPLRDHEGLVIGHLAFLDEKRMSDGVLLDSIYRIFTARAAAELIRHQMQRTVSDLVTGLSQASGDETFRTLVKSFASVMGVREAFVTECNDEPDPLVQVLAWWRDGCFEGEPRYALSGSVCEETVREGKLCFYPQGVSQRFPRAQPLSREAYVGVPCRDANGRVIGHIACCSDRPMQRELPDQAILKLFAERASIELERRRFSREHARAQSSAMN
jgi:PAS domain S-box-containing protein